MDKGGPMTLERADGRTPGEMREIKILTGVNEYAEGSCEISFGRTRVLCTATVEKETPRWMEPGSETGWITAEYGMLPRATLVRTKREAATGKQGGRTLEIQRIIGRSLRQAVDLNLIKGITIRLDCDVISADGGTRTASISGAWIALAQAVNKAASAGLIAAMPPLAHVAAVSVGKLNGEFFLDLDYSEDSHADFDLNVVLNEGGDIIEIQGTAEKGVLRMPEFDAVLKLAQKGITQIIARQKAAFT